MKKLTEIFTRGATYMCWLLFGVSSFWFITFSFYLRVAGEPLV